MFTKHFIKEIFKVLATIKNKKMIFPNFSELKNIKSYYRLYKTAKYTISTGIGGAKMA